MKYSLTIFRNTYDNKTDATVTYETWEEFVDALRNMSTKKGVKGGKHSSPLISPARFEQGSTRSNKNVTLWGGWAAVDVDSFELLEHMGLAESLQDICGQYKFACYSTASSTPIQPKFRLVFPLTSEVMVEDIPHFWYALNKRLQSLGDEQTKDMARMYYVPAEYPDAFNFFFENEGREINPQELMEAYPYSKPTGNNFLDRLPEAMRKEIVEYRKSKSDKKLDYSSYRDCPFFPKKLAQEYMTINGTGWYHKMYQIMVATAARAVELEHNITANEIANLCRELDNDNGKWYDNRPLEVEADRAIEYVYRNL